jgi:hypothetical protein
MNKYKFKIRKCLFHKIGKTLKIKKLKNIVKVVIIIYIKNDSIIIDN